MLQYRVWFCPGLASTHPGAASEAEIVAQLMAGRDEGKHKIDFWSNVTLRIASAGDYYPLRFCARRLASSRRLVVLLGASSGAFGTSSGVGAGWVSVTGIAGASSPGRTSVTVRSGR